jgi:hypothetical protein
MKMQNISNLTLERYILRELPEKQINEIDLLCRDIPELKEKIDTIKNSNKEILNSYSEEKIVAEIKTKYSYSKEKKKITGRPSGQILKQFIFPVSIATAAVILFFTLPAIKTSFNDITGTNSSDIVRLKGNESAIYLYRKIKNEVDNLANGSSAKSGDLLQIAYISKSDQYGIIFSIDGRGTVTLHYPASNISSTKLITGKKVLLNNSYELDDAPDFERFFLITSGSKLDVNTVLNAAHFLARDKQNVESKEILIADLKEKINQTSIKIIKSKQ